MIPNQKGRRKLETLVHRVVVRYWRKKKDIGGNENLGSSPGNRQKTKLQRQLTALESDIHKGILLKYFFL